MNTSKKIFVLFLFSVLHLTGCFSSHMIGRGEHLHDEKVLKVNWKHSLHYDSLTLPSYKKPFLRGKVLLERVSKEKCQKVYKIYQLHQTLDGFTREIIGYRKSRPFTREKKDSRSRRPLAGARVEIFYKNRVLAEVVTDEEGNFSVPMTELTGEKTLAKSAKNSQKIPLRLVVKYSSLKGGQKERQIQIGTQWLPHKKDIRLSHKH